LSPYTLDFSFKNTKIFLKSLFHIDDCPKKANRQRCNNQRNNHLLSIKMRQSDSLKSYISFFQSQLAKVSNYREDIFVLTFISGLHVSHSLYKHLFKHNVTRMSEVLSRVQPYIQLKEAMNTSFNHTAKHDDIGGKSKSPYEVSAHAQDRNRGQSAFKRQALPILLSNSL